MKHNTKERQEIFQEGGGRKRRK